MVKSPPLDLYRVGEPSIGETWPSRFNFNRSTGGLGAGVYAFRGESAAKRNEDQEWTNGGLFVLRNALTNPIQPRTGEATDQLAWLSRALVLLAREVRRDNITFDRARERGEYLRYTVNGGLFGEPGVENEDADTSYASTARDVLFNTPELRERYGYDTEDFVLDAYDAAEEALSKVEAADTRFWGVGGLQPINILLYPEYDGVAPLDGAGGNSGKHGCVIFKQRIDACVGRETATFDEVSAEALNACWGGR